MTKLITLLMVFVLCGCERVKEDPNCIIIESRSYWFGYHVLIGDDRKICGIKNLPQLAALIRGELYDMQNEQAK